MNTCPNCSAPAPPPAYLPPCDGQPAVLRYVCRCGATWDIWMEVACTIDIAPPILSQLVDFHEYDPKTDTHMVTVIGEEGIVGVTAFPVEKGKR